MKNILKNIGDISIQILSIDRYDDLENSYVTLPFIRFDVDHELPFFFISLLSICFKDRFRFAILDFGEWVLFQVFRSEYWKFSLKLFNKEIIKIPTDKRTW